MMQYQIKVGFVTQDPLTAAELDALAVACLVQVEDPADHTGENKRANFQTHDVWVETEAEERKTISRWDAVDEKVQKQYIDLAVKKLTDSAFLTLVDRPLEDTKYWDAIVAKAQEIYEEK